MAVEVRVASELRFEDRALVQKVLLLALEVYDVIGREGFARVLDRGELAASAVKALGIAAHARGVRRLAPPERPENLRSLRHENATYRTLRVKRR